MLNLAIDRGLGCCRLRHLLGYICFILNETTKYMTIVSYIDLAGYIRLII